MELSEILTLLERFDASTATSLKLELGDLRLKLEKGTAAPAAAGTVAAVQVAAPVQVPAAASAPAEPEGVEVQAPLVGTFYAAPAPGEAPFVSVGDTVKKGQTLCVLEAMKMMSEVPAPMDCVILEVLAKDGELMGFDTPLFRVREL